MEQLLSFLVPLIFCLSTAASNPQYLVVKSYDNQFCIAFNNKAISVETCQWRTPNVTQNPLLEQQLVTILATDFNQEDIDASFERVPTPQPRLSAREGHSDHHISAPLPLPENNPYYSIRMTKNQCLTTFKSKDTIGFGKCGSHQSKFIIRKVPVNNLSHPYGFSIESRHNKCLGFDGRGPTLVKQQCEYSNRSRHSTHLHQLWVLCSPEGSCNFSPDYKQIDITSSTTTTSTIEKPGISGLVPTTTFAPEATTITRGIGDTAPTENTGTRLGSNGGFAVLSVMVYYLFDLCIA